MELVHFHLEIEFTETGQIDTPAYRVYKALAGKPKQTRLEEPGVRISDGKKSTLINWEYDSCEINVENEVNGDKCIEFATKYIDRYY